MARELRMVPAESVDSERERLVAEVRRLRADLEMERDRRIAAEVLARLSTVALEQFRNRSQPATSKSTETKPSTKRLRGNWLDPETLDRFAAD
jgi:hypothetical protein